MKKFILLLMLSCSVIGCQTAENVPEPKIFVAENKSQESDLKLTFVGKFYGGYDDNRRDVYTMAFNGKIYLVVTGCGVTELIDEADSDGKGTHTSEE